MDAQEDFDRTHKVLLEVVKDINEHMINLLIEKNYHDVTYDRDYQLYKGQAEKQGKEILLREQMEELDELNYLKEKQ